MTGRGDDTGETGRVPGGTSAMLPHDQPTDEIARDASEEPDDRTGAHRMVTEDDFDPDADDLRTEVYSRDRTAGGTTAGTPTTTQKLSRDEVLGTGDPHSSYDLERAYVAPVSTTAAEHTTTGDRTTVAPVRVRRGTTDLGLLLLRWLLAAILLGHGARVLLGWWGGDGLDGTADLLTAAGFRDADPLALGIGIALVAAGALLVLGLATPIAAAAALTVAVIGWLLHYTQTSHEVFAPTGLEYPTVIAALAAIVVLVGPGRYALEGGRGWSTRPFVGSFVLLLLGAGGAAAIWLLLR